MRQTLYLFFILLTCSCEVEPIPETPFWEIIEGDWKLNPDYVINGTEYTFSDYDLNHTRLTFLPITDFNNIGYAAWAGILGTKFNRTYLEIENIIGLYILNGAFISELPKLINH